MTFRKLPAPPPCLSVMQPKLENPMAVTTAMKKYRNLAFMSFPLSVVYHWGAEHLSKLLVYR